MSAFALQAHQHPRRRQRRWSRAAGFTYGNGLIHNRTLNARGLPYQIRDRNGGTSLLNYTYSYDAHGNLTGLTDTTLPGPWTESRNLAYDARDRMTLATAPGIFGEEVYDYDVLDNVRRMAVYPNGSGGGQIGSHPLSRKDIAQAMPLHPKPMHRVAIPMPYWRILPRRKAGRKIIAL